MTDKSRPVTTLSTPSDQEIVITRVFNAPRRLVFEAWTKPEHVRLWYGPRDLTLSVCEIDLRPGGSYRYVLRDASGDAHIRSGMEQGMRETLNRLEEHLVACLFLRQSGNLIDLAMNRFTM